MPGIPDAYVHDRKRSRHPGPQLFRKMFQKIYRKFVLRTSETAAIVLAEPFHFSIGNSITGGFTI